MKKIAKKYKKDLEIAYWPIIENSYWISPFSNQNDLKRLFSNLEKINNSLLIDLELPLKKEWKLYFKNIFQFRQNKKIIQKFLKKNQSRITTAEYPFTIVSKILKWFGLNYDINYERSIMWYSSMLSEKFNSKIKRNLLKTKNKKNFSISLGTIAIGILGNEPILLPKKLDADLNFVKKAGFEKVIIFRLEGLNKKYIKILEKYSKR